MGPQGELPAATAAARVHGRVHSRGACPGGGLVQAQLWLHRRGSGRPPRCRRPWAGMKCTVRGVHFAGRTSRSTAGKGAPSPAQSPHPHPVVAMTRVPLPKTQGGRGTGPAGSPQQPSRPVPGGLPTPSPPSTEWTRSPRVGAGLGPMSCRLRCCPSAPAGSFCLSSHHHTPGSRPKGSDMEPGPTGASSIWSGACVLTEGPGTQAEQNSSPAVAAVTRTHGAHVLPTGALQPAQGQGERGPA